MVRWRDGRAAGLPVRAPRGGGGAVLPQPRRHVDCRRQRGLLRRDPARDDRVGQLHQPDVQLRAAPQQAAALVLGGGGLLPCLGRVARRVTPAHRPRRDRHLRHRVPAGPPGVLDARGPHRRPHARGDAADAAVLAPHHHRRLHRDVPRPDPAVLPDGRNRAREPPAVAGGDVRGGRARRADQGPGGGGHSRARLPRLPRGDRAAAQPRPHDAAGGRAHCRRDRRAVLRRALRPGGLGRHCLVPPPGEPRAVHRRRRGPRPRAAVLPPGGLRRPLPAVVAPPAGRAGARAVARHRARPGGRAGLGGSRSIHRPGTAAARPLDCRHRRLLLPVERAAGPLRAAVCRRGSGAGRRPARRMARRRVGEAARPRGNGKRGRCGRRLRPDRGGRGVAGRGPGGPARPGRRDSRQGLSWSPAASGPLPRWCGARAPRRWRRSPSVSLRHSGSS